MTPDERKAFANESEKALLHPLVQEVIAELLSNLNRQGDSLAQYGIRKVASYAAQVARAQALGIDIEELRITPEEVAQHQAMLLRTALDAGKDVFIVGGATVED